MGSPKEPSRRIPLWLDCDPGTKAHWPTFTLSEADILQGMTLVLVTGMHSDEIAHKSSRMLLRFSWHPITPS
jgi:hypothetical protein